jgi:DNA-binding XRE family transcriptional regulator
MATSRPFISEASIHPDAMTGNVLRQLREGLGMSQDRLASMVGITRPALNNIEQHNRIVPPTVAAGALAIKAAKDSGAISLPRKATWRNSKGFKQRPPFEVLPPNGTACGCKNPSCRLYAVCDGDWPAGHLWCFQSHGCYRRVYLDAMGNTVPSPGKNVSRVPAEVCSGCGHKKALDGKDSKRFGQKIYIRRCRQDPKDPPSLRHDDPTYWWEKNGKMVRMPPAAIEQLHGRSRRLFPVPKCEREGCPRNGKTMERSNVLHLATHNGGRCKIATYRCRATKAHPEYRVLPCGEIATRLGMGRYRWRDSVTRETHETARGRDGTSPQWRPADWDSKPLWWKVAGEYLLKHRDATNANVAAHLDKMGVRRRSEVSWTIAIQKEQKQSIMNNMRDVRIWVRVPGRTPGKKPVNPPGN